MWGISKMDLIVIKVAKRGIMCSLKNKKDVPNWEEKMAGQFPDDSTLLEIEEYAKEIANAAGQILLRHFLKHDGLDVSYKDDKERDPVTNADHEVQDYLSSAIRYRFPSHAVLGEEDEKDNEGDKELAPDYVWVLDPLAGTKNFLSGLPIFASSIAVLFRGVPVVAAVFLPWPVGNSGIVMHARRGGGAYIDETKLSVQTLDSPKANRLTTLPGGFMRLFNINRHMSGRVGEVRMTGSIVYELSLVAKGVPQYTFTTAPFLWDAAAGVLLVMESGGQVLRAEKSRFVKLSFVPGRWTTFGGFVDRWESGKTTMSDLRKWRGSLLLGHPNVVDYIATNMSIKSLRLRKIQRWVIRKMKK